MGARRAACLLAGFAAGALLIYAPSFRGSFVSDDVNYVELNPYVQELGWSNLAAFLDPAGDMTLISENYSPLPLLLHGLQWKLFAADVRGYRVSNALLHALASALLVAVLLRSGLPPGASAVGGAFFLVHPANVEAVAWISQLRGPLALALALGALLAHPRRPGLGALLFALALLSKPLAACALPAALLFGRARERARVPSWRWGWLGVWAGALLLFFGVERAAFQATSGIAEFAYPDPAERLRSVAAIALRYLVMAASSAGLSAFHEPPPAASWLDPRWLAALGIGAGVAWRALATGLRREAEAGYWAWAACAWAPVAGLVWPLTYPMADRYLYFALPGLIGASLLMGAGWVRRLGSTPRAAQLRLAGALAAAALLAAFAARSYQRAAVWQSNATVNADARAHYPDGLPARLQNAREAALRGQHERALTELERARSQGFDRYGIILRDPAFGPLQPYPRFQALVRSMARDEIERWSRREPPSQLVLRVIAGGHRARGETQAAIAALERALALGGPFDAPIRADLQALRGEAAAPRP